MNYFEENENLGVQPEMETNNILPIQPLNTKYKTQICRHFETQGTCHLGDRCHYAHGNIELRSATDVCLI